MMKLRNVARSLSLVTLLGSASALATGCGSDKAPSTGHPLDSEFKDFCHLPQPCRDIAQACMPKDDGSKGMIHDCHLTGHTDGTLAACAPIHDACVATCDAAPGFSDGPVEDLSAVCHDGGAPAM